MPDIYAVIEAHRAALLARESSALLEIGATYDQVESRILTELQKLTRKIEDARAAGELLSPAWLFQQRRLSDLLKQVTAEMQVFSANAAVITENAQRSAATMAQIHFEQAITAQVGDQAAQVGTTFNRLPSRAVESFIGAAGDGSPLRRLFDQLGPAASKSIRDKLVQGVALGWNPTKTASAIKDALGGNRARAKAIARTETMRAYREASHLTAQENEDVLTGWTWYAGLKGSCAACIALHGTFHKLDERMASHVNCRCTQFFETKSLEEIGISGVTEDPIPPVERGEAWFAKQSAAVQTSVLGIAGAKAYRAGDVKLTDFVGLARSKDWGDSFHQRSLRDARTGAEKGVLAKLASKPPVTPAPPKFDPLAAEIARLKQRPTNIQATYKAGARERLERLFGRPVGDDELAHAVGALDGAKLSVLLNGNNVSIEIEHPDIDTQDRTIRRKRNGEIIVHNDYFRKRASAPPGIGLESFSRQAFGARALGIVRIETYAAGDKNDPRFNGYYTWARLGYNARLTLQDRTNLPAQLKSAKTVGELFDLPGGADWWREWGKGRDMEFDLAQDGESFRRLIDYIRSRKNL